MKSWIDFAGELVDSYGLIPALVIALLIGMAVGWIWKTLIGQKNEKEIVHTQDVEYNEDDDLAGILRRFMNDRRENP